MKTYFNGVIAGELWMGGAAEIELLKELKPGRPIRARIVEMLRKQGDLQPGTHHVVPGSLVEFRIHRNNRAIQRFVRLA